MTQVLGLTILDEESSRKHSSESFPESLPLADFSTDDLAKQGTKSLKGQSLFF